MENLGKEKMKMQCDFLFTLKNHRKSGSTTTSDGRVHVCLCIWRWRNRQWHSNWCLLCICKDNHDPHP